jgi:hypothetical protein
MKLNTSPSGLETLGIVSAAVAVVAAFLPWITAGAEVGPVEVSGSVAGVDQNVGVLALILAVVAVAVVLLVGFEAEGSLATAVVGIVVLGVGCSNSPTCPASPPPGSGCT